MEIDVRHVLPVPQEPTVTELMHGNFTNSWIMLPDSNRFVYVRYHDTEHIWVASMGMGTYNEVVYSLLDMPRRTIVRDGVKFLLGRLGNSAYASLRDNSYQINPDKYIPHLEGDKVVVYETFFSVPKVLIDIPEVKWIKTIQTFSNGIMRDLAIKQDDCTDRVLKELFKKEDSMGTLHRVVDQFFQLRADGKWHVVSRHAAKNSSILRDVIYAYELAQKFNDK